MNDGGIGSIVDGGGWLRFIGGGSGHVLVLSLVVVVIGVHHFLKWWQLDQTIQFGHTVKYPLEGEFDISPYVELPVNTVQ